MGLNCEKNMILVNLSYYIFRYLYSMYGILCSLSSVEWRSSTPHPIYSHWILTRCTVIREVNYCARFSIAPSCVSMRHLIREALTHQVSLTCRPTRMLIPHLALVSKMLIIVCLFQFCILLPWKFLATEGFPLFERLLADSFYLVYILLSCYSLGQCCGSGSSNCYSVKLITKWNIFTSFWTYPYIFYFLDVAVKSINHFQKNNLEQSC